MFVHSFAFSFASGICSTSTSRSPISTVDSATGVCQACQAEAPVVLDSSVLNSQSEAFCILFASSCILLAFFCSFCSWFFLLVGLEISNLISLQIVDFFLCRWYLLIRRGVEELLKYFEARYLLITWATKDTIVDWSLYGVLRLY